MSADLVDLLVTLAASVPATQRVLDLANARTVQFHAANPNAVALLGPPGLQSISSVDISVDALVGRSRTAGAGIEIWPLNLGLAVLHQVSSTHAARLTMSIVADHGLRAGTQPESGRDMT